VVGRIDYIDGLRGIGAMIVFLFHFVLAFPTRAYTGIRDWGHLDILFDGRFAIGLFFVMSGFVLTYKFFSTGEREILFSSISRRYFRFLPSVAAAVFLSYLFMVCGIYRNLSAGELIGPGTWLGLWNNFPPEFTGMLKEAFISTFFGNAPWNQFRYVHVLWTMSYEFAGSMLVLGLAALFGKSRWRGASYIAAAWYFATTYYLGFIIGMLLADHQVNGKTFSPKSKALMTSFAICSAYIGLTSPSEMVYNTTRASFAIFIAMSSIAVQRVLANRILQALGRISFSFYILQLIILFSFSSTLFVWMYGVGFAYDTTVFVVFVCTLLATAISASIFQAAIDDRGIELSHRIYEFLREVLVFLLCGWKSRMGS
jgi:peptidoglycan/LPS O-acetylase OafA/YrhL